MLIFHCMTVQFVEYNLLLQKKFVLSETKLLEATRSPAAQMTVGDRLDTVRCRSWRSSSI